MKLRNKKSGEIGTLTLSSNGEDLLIMKNNEMVTHSVKLSDLEEWEDYEEPKGHWAIDMFGEPIDTTNLSSFHLKKLQRYGNDFPTEEETKKVIERLCAWKRLKDKGLKIHLQKQFRGNGIGYSRTIYTDFTKDSQEIVKDLDLLFGG